MTNNICPEDCKDRSRLCKFVVCGKILKLPKCILGRFNKMMHAKFLTQPSVHTIKPQCPTDVNCEDSDDGDDDGAVL